jgi:hypothetical protein
MGGVGSGGFHGFSCAPTCESAHSISAALSIWPKTADPDFPAADPPDTFDCVLREGGVRGLLIAIIEIGAAPFGLKTTSSLGGRNGSWDPP